VPSKTHKRAWQDWGTVNPLYGILTDPRYRHGGDVGEFLESGEGAVASVLAEVERLGLAPRQHACLDFGCGIGRLTGPLARRFDLALGLDVSAPMLAKARSIHADLANCRFELNDTDDLAGRPDASFDLVLCLFVLQHLDTTRAIESFLGEFVRVLAPGGALVVQLCSQTANHRPPLPPWRTRHGARTRAAIALRRMGVPPGILYRTLDWVPEMTMLAIPDERARTVLRDAGGRVVSVSPPETDAGGTVHRTYYVTREASAG
jgi:SAM-dependent methyltransferase